MLATVVSSAVVESGGSTENAVIKKSIFAITLATTMAFLTLVGAVPFAGSLAVANSCQHCRDAHDACRIKRKGNASCDRELERCLKSCLKSYRKK